MPMRGTNTLATGTIALVLLAAGWNRLAAEPARPQALVAQAAPPSTGAARVPLPVPAPAALRSEDAPADGTDVALLGNKIPAPGSSIFMADVMVGERLKALLAAPLDRHISRRRDREGVQGFYRDNGYVPLWVANGAPSLRATMVMGVLAAAAAHGLDPADYAVPDFGATQGDPDKLAAAELKLTDAVLTYARHAQAGRFGAQRITPELDVTQVVPEAADVLKRIAASPSAAKAAAALEAYHPPHAGYRALRAKLAELRSKGEAGATLRIPDGPLLRPGMRDARVPLLRQRFGLPAKKGDERYDERLFAAVRQWQEQAGLRGDGVIGRASLALLNRQRSRQEMIDLVIANMERWRWLPRDLGSAHVLVNIPDFTLHVVNNGSTLWSTRIIVGKPATPTPLLSAEFSTMQLNPTWHVPESIIYNEYLPALQRDPRALQRMGLVLERAADGRITVKQPPGEENALGQIKFNFVNRFMVYLHDTPGKHLFQRPVRAFSHGCVRVEDPARFGELLLSLSQPQEQYSAERLRQSFGGPEQWLRLKRKVPVHIVYFSAFVDAGGRLQLRDDIYDFDRRTLAMLKGTDARLADSYAPPETKPTEISLDKRRALEAIVERQKRGAGLADFFEQVFRPR